MNLFRRRPIWLLALLLVPSTAPAGERLLLSIPSTIDGSLQPSYLIVPAGFDPEGEPVPLLVMLHSWSGDVEQRQRAWEEGAEQRGWLYLFPNFRGPNRTPEACGSPLAQQDILDAVNWVSQRYPVDRRRIYLAGSSGGGHMTMLMAGRHADTWAAATAWVGISDLARWHAERSADNYARMLEAVCGGAPGESAAIDAEYQARSPLTHLAGAADLPLDLAAGIHDGHQGSVPIHHTLDAFNVLARANGTPAIAEDETAQLGQPDGRLLNPQPSDTAADPTYGERAIHLRRTSGNCRVTIFEGGHEGLAEPALEWLSGHAKGE